MGELISLDKYRAKKIVKGVATMDVVEFAERVLGFKLHPYQKEMMKIIKYKIPKPSGRRTI